MMLDIEEQWPLALPLPSIDFGQQPVTATLVSPPTMIANLRRSRFTRSYNRLMVVWHFSVAQYEAFQTFVETELGNGVAQFAIELRFPKNSELTEWAVKLSPQIQATYEEGIWTVQTSLQLMSPMEI